MFTPTRLIPNQLVPQLRVKTVGGPCWRLCDQKPKHFTLVVFYRGLHCSFSKAHLQAFEALYDEFLKIGVRVLAVSADGRDRAERAVADWGLDELTVCWGLTLDQACSWGLFLTKGRGQSAEGVDEPDWFVEPAMFLIKPDGTLFGSQVQTMPVINPRIDDMLDGIRYVVETNCEPSGGSLESECATAGYDCGCAAPVKLAAVGQA